MKVIVIGSGIVGTASAWFLNQAGHQVTVIEREPGPSQETTFANGCQISVSHSEPWANPSAPKKVLKWLGKEDAPLLFRFKGDRQQISWALNFLRECTQSRTHYNIRQCMALADFSQRTLRALRDSLHIEYDYMTNGIMHFFTDKDDFESSKAGAKLMTDLGCPRHSIDAAEVVRIEPTLAGVEHKIAGGDFTPGDEHGDSRVFTIGLAEKARENGVAFHFNTTAVRLLTEGTGAAARIVGVETITPTGAYEVMKADAFVIAMGSYATPFLKPLGISLQVYPVKGYSATFPIINPDAAPKVSLIDSTRKLVFATLGNRLRVGGTAEINGYDRLLNQTRCEALVERTRELFPDSCDFSQTNFWSGLRPTTPSNRPYIGKMKFPNLYLNVGHGTLGWTMGCGSGRAIADIVSGLDPEVNYAFLKG